ncbi:endonuclease/exonuclease/phosphatase family protein [Shimia sp. MMG029]|uniref:endonuclease/exonuclease/phosphatase family protein n=1 Tax=Shimia sp. MMG029 TaxID=3021978 RepID=UPI003F8D9DE9
MLRDILRREDQTRAVTQVVAHVAPDILFLQGVDYDADLLGAKALQDQFAEAGVAYTHLFALPPNTGVPTALDMNGDGYLHDAEDAQGFGHFRGASGLLVLSRWPFGAVEDYSTLLWRDLPNAQMPDIDGAPFPSIEAQAIQ